MQFVPETAYCTFGHANTGKRGGKPISADAVFSENLLLVA